MKSFCAVLLISLAARHEAVSAPIKPVIDMLSKMLSDSKTDGASDDKLFNSFRDHCVSTKAEAESQIAGMAETSEALAAGLDRLNAEKDKTNDEIADLNNFLAKNNESQTSANSVRQKEIEQYKKDLTHQQGLVRGLSQASSKLGGGSSLLALDEAASLGLEGAASTAWERLRQTDRKGQAKSFLQVRGFGEVKGILENSLKQANADLESLNQTEDAALVSYAKLAKSLRKSETSLTDTISSKTSLAGSLAAEIATKEGQRKTARKTLKDDNAFLSDLTKNCQKKTQNHEERSELRRQEEAAVKMALVVLDGPRGDKVFKKTDATSLVQMTSVPVDGPFVPELVTMLQAEAAKSGSARLSKIAALVRVQAKMDGNPFAVVLSEIEKMKARISKESVLDKRQLKWCGNERATSKSALDSKETELTSLDTAITDLNASIEGPTTGLLAIIAKLETQLSENVLEQKKETDERNAENQEYVKEIKTIVLAQGMLKKALSTLQDYYADMKAHRLNSLVQTDKPAAFNATSMGNKASGSNPDYKLSKYEGQSETGTAVITKLTEILKGSEKEETAAHKGEADAQEAFEDTMALLTKQQTDQFEGLAENKKDLAVSMLDLQNRGKEEAAAEKQKATMLEYMRTIKPACDFITTSFDTREASRGLEKESLTKAQSLIQDSPAYKKLSDVAKRK